MLEEGTNNQILRTTLYSEDHGDTHLIYCNIFIYEKELIEDLLFNNETGRKDKVLLVDVDCFTTEKQKFLQT